MSIVTVAQLKSYANLADGDVTREALYQTMIDSAEAVVSDYLGYAPSATSYTHTFFGDGKPYINLRAPVNGTITSITIDSVAQTVSDWLVDFERITNKYNKQFSVGSLAVVAYSGGFATIPAQVSEAVLSIASLKCMQMGSAIGLTSQSFDGGNTRNFMSYTNYSKYLAPLASIRVDRIERNAP